MYAVPIGYFTERYTTYLPQYIDDEPTRYCISALDIIATRARLLSAGNVLNTAALDPYLLLRDLWVQQHRRAVLDGRDPAENGDAPRTNRHQR